MTRPVVLILAFMVFGGVGCSSTNRQDAQLDEPIDQPSEEESDSMIDQLWREGYGFNNPNPERKRQGKPLLNFDGTVYEECPESTSDLDF